MATLAEGRLCLGNQGFMECGIKAGWGGKMLRKREPELRTAKYWLEPTVTNENDPYWVGSFSKEIKAGGRQKRCRTLGKEGGGGDSRNTKNVRVRLYIGEELSGICAKEDFRKREDKRKLATRKKGIKGW